MNLEIKKASVAEKPILSNLWRGGRLVEGARLEIVYAVKRIRGSNPLLSAIVYAIQTRHYHARVPCTQPIMGYATCIIHDTPISDMLYTKIHRIGKLF
jgi:hypothetical protein